VDHDIGLLEHCFITMRELDIIIHFKILLCPKIFNICYSRTFYLMDELVLMSFVVSYLVSVFGG